MQNSTALAGTQELNHKFFKTKYNLFKSNIFYSCYLKNVAVWKILLYLKLDLVNVCPKAQTKLLHTSISSTLLMIFILHLWKPCFDIEEHYNLRSPHTHTGCLELLAILWKACSLLLMHLVLPKKSVFVSKAPHTTQIRELLNCLADPSSYVASHP